MGGYAAVHARPPAFEGMDGTAYSVEVMADETGEPGAPWGAYLFFVRWSSGNPALAGHIESAFLARGATEADARVALGRLSLAEAKRTLDALLSGGGS